MTDSLTRYETTFESTKNLPMVLAFGHGENADLVASFKDNGVDVDLTGFSARAIYQPSSKWGTDGWYECPCEIVDNAAVAHWGNTYDNGDDAVKLFLHLVKNGKVAYPAIYQIRLFASPGFSPSAIEPIPETIDFAQYQIENAPWVTQTDFDTLSETVSSISTEIVDTNAMIFNKVVKLIPYGPSARFVLMNRWQHSLQRRDFPSFSPKFTLPEPDHEDFTVFYCTLDIMNIAPTPSYSSDATLTLIQPDNYTWTILVDDGLTLSEVLTVPSGRIARFYISQVGGYNKGTTSNWDAMYIKRVLLADVTP